VSTLDTCQTSTAVAAPHRFNGSKGRAAPTGKPPDFSDPGTVWARRATPSGRSEQILRTFGPSKRAPRANLRRSLRPMATARN